MERRAWQTRFTKTRDLKTLAETPAGHSASRLAAHGLASARERNCINSVKAVVVRMAQAADVFLTRIRLEMYAKSQVTKRWSSARGGYGV